MKEKKKNVREDSAALAAPVMPAKTIRTKSGKQMRQYPPSPGYHGTQDEKTLSPEE